MKSNKFWAAVSRALAAMTAMLIVALMLVPGAWACKYKTLYQFKVGADGLYPRAGLIFDPAGNLYGTTDYGGAYNFGTVFQLTPNGDGSWTESVLHSFNADGKDGYEPFAGLIFDPAGNLYGTTNNGGAYGSYGMVFQLTPNGDGSWTESVLHSFNADGKDGYEPFAGLIFDPAGNLYGTTGGGGAYGHGTVFQLTPNRDGSWTESLLHSFNLDGKDGYEPLAGLTFDPAGNLYGTTNWGGAYNYGTVFQLTPNGDGSWTESVLHSFNLDGKDGYKPLAGLTFDPAGNLYGTTPSGGTNDDGTVFKLKPTVKGSWKETVLHSFRNHPGAFPFWSGLILDGHGSLYGTTHGLGPKTRGSVFEITP